MYKVSFLWFATIGTLLTIIFALIISLITGILSLHIHHYSNTFNLSLTVYLTLITAIFRSYERRKHWSSAHESNSWLHNSLFAEEYQTEILVQCSLWQEKAISWGVKFSFMLFSFIMIKKMHAFITIYYLSGILLYLSTDVL